MQYMTGNKLETGKGVPPDNNGVTENSFPNNFLNFTL